MTYISDHAVLQYLATAKGIDIDAIRAEMTTPGVIIAGQIGCDTVRMSNGTRLKLHGDVVCAVHMRRRKGSRSKHPMTAAEVGIPELQAPPVRADAYVPEGS